MCNGGGAADCGESDSQFGSTALIYAAACGHADCVRLLIDAGADKEATADVRTRSRPMFHIDKFMFLTVFICLHYFFI